MNNKFIVIIPARNGSKRFPGKNHKTIAGKSLLKIKLEQCMHKKLGDILVTSDDKKILKEAKKIGVKYLRNRPKAVSGDVSSTKIVYDAVKYYEKITKSNIDFFVLSQLTTPFIKKKDLYETTNFFYENKKFNSLIACRSIELESFFWCFFKNKSKEYQSLSKKLKKQIGEFTNNKEAFIPNGGIYIVRRSKLKKTGQLYTNPVKIWVMDKHISLDIDYEEDLILARHYVKKFNNKN